MAQNKKKIDVREQNNRYISNVVSVFIYLILCVFPLFFTNYYFNILESKYIFYWVSVVTLLVILFGMMLCLKWDDTVVYFKNFKLKTWLKSFILPDWMMLAFFLTAVISTLLSDYKYEAFWGNNGRYSGLFLISLYCICYFTVTRLARFKARFLDAFLASGMLVCVFGITDYFKMDILHFKVNMKPEQIASYTSTIGNINTYTAYVALIMAIAFILYCTSKDLKKMIVYYVCFIISLFAIIMGISDNAYLSLAALFGLAPFYLFANRRGLKRYIVGLLSFFAVIKCIAWINTSMPDKVFGIYSSFNKIVAISGLATIMVLLSILVVILCVWDYVKKNSGYEPMGKWLRWFWLVIVVFVVVGVVYSVYDATFLGNGEKYGSFREYLEFNDAWGTHRGYIWRMGMELYNEFSLSRKLFGFGPDTYGILTVMNRYNEMIEKYNMVFDSAHNEYLHYLITMGVFGTITYAGLFVTSLITYTRRALNRPHVMAICFAVTCYAIQAVVNINLPIATPIVMTLLMVGLAECRYPRVGAEELV